MVDTNYNRCIRRWLCEFLTGLHYPVRFCLKQSTVAAAATAAKSNRRKKVEKERYRK